MPNSEISEPESEENISSDENETANVKGSSRNRENLSEYEKQRLNRIEENKKRMEALGLHKMANTLMGSVKKTQKIKNDKKGKKKLGDEDEEYNPTEDDDDDEEMSGSDEDDENDDEFSGSQKKKVKKNTSTSKKRAPIKNRMFDSDYVDDDDALMKAIALSLQDSSAGFLNVKSSSPRSNNATSKTPAKDIIDATSDKRKEIVDESGKRKRKKSVTSRVQMSEDEMLVHFFQFDESGKGGVTLRDIERLAIAHDFTWSEKEMADMVHCFDSDGDGKINFDDFCKIVGRCNMLKASDDAVTS